MIRIFHKRAFPAKLIALGRLFRRLPIIHPLHDRVKMDLYHASAGHGGEELVDNVLKSIHFPLPYAVFPNIRLFEQSIPSTQIDILLITPAYALILEVKNWSGSVTFQPIGQVIQRRDEASRSLDCPTIQANTIRNHVVDWLSKYQVNLPVYQCVVFPYASTMIHGAENRNILFSKELPIFIRKLNKLPRLLSDSAFNKLSQKVKLADHPFIQPPICRQYDLTIQNLTKGLFCERCDAPLHRHSLKVHVCKACLYIPENPYIEAMQDWFTLIHPHVKNNELADFTKTPSPRTVSYFMSLSGFPATGDKKSRKYHFNEKSRAQFLSNQRIKK